MQLRWEKLGKRKSLMITYDPGKLYPNFCKIMVFTLFLNFLIFLSRKCHKSPECYGFSTSYTLIYKGNKTGQKLPKTISVQKSM